MTTFHCYAILIFTSSDSQDKTNMNIETVSDEALVNLIRLALATQADITEERPPDSDDFKDHLPISLNVLSDLLSKPIKSLSETVLQSLLILCSEHCSSSSRYSRVWSSVLHQEKAHQLLEVISQDYGKSISVLLTENDCMRLKSIFSYLQPKLEHFMKNPSSIHAVTWLTQQVPHPHLGQLVPRLLPLVLNLTDCWLPYYKISGCDLIQHIVTSSPASELMFYGRAELLSDAMFRLLSHTDPGVVRAASGPLLVVTRTRHGDSHPPATPGPGDILMKEVITRLDMCSDHEARAVYCDMMEATVTMLGVGVARWVSRLCEVITSQLDISPPASVFRTVSTLTQVCPQCVAREVAVLLPALVKYQYQVSWHQDQDTDLARLASVCTDQVSTCDIEATRTLCHDLKSVTPVNDSFDSLVEKLLLKVS